MVQLEDDEHKAEEIAEVMYELTNSTEVMVAELIDSDEVEVDMDEIEVYETDLEMMISEQDDEVDM